VLNEVPIRGQVIRLGQLLKLTGSFDTGADVKAFLQTEAVFVNGEREVRRGRQLFPGDVVRVGEHELRVTSSAQGTAPRPKDPRARRGA
jgi:ribosome-associated protein